MKNVVKRNGKKEPFDIEKVKKSIKKAYIDAGVSIADNKEKIETMTKEILKSLKDKTDITTKTIKKMVLDSLDKTKKVASDAWKKFDKKYKTDEDEIDE